MEKIILTKTECAIAKLVGEARNDFARSKGYQMLVSNRRPTKDNDIMGVAGELVVAKWLNIYPDLRTDQPSDYDLDWEGYKLQVKTTDHPFGNLLVEEFSKRVIKDEYVYILVKGTMPEFMIMGYMMGDKIKLAGKEHENKNGTKYWIVSINHLLPLPRQLT